MPESDATPGARRHWATRETVLNFVDPDKGTDDNQSEASTALAETHVLVTVSSSKGEVIAHLNVSLSDTVDAVRRRIEQRVGIPAPLQRLLRGGEELGPGMALGGGAGKSVNLTLSSEPLSWDPERCAGYVEVGKGGREAKSHAAIGDAGFASPGHEVLSRAALREGPFTFAARLREHRGGTIALVGVAQADVDVTGDEAHVNASSSWLCGSDGITRHNSDMWPSGNKIGVGDVVVVHWRSGTLTFMLNGETAVGSFSGVPLPLRAYAHCCDGTKWELSACQQVVWDAERCGEHVRLFAEDRVAVSMTPLGELGFGQPGHEVLGRVAFVTGPFSFLARFRAPEGGIGNALGVARAGLRPDEDSHVTDGSAWTYASDSRRRYRGLFSAYGEAFATGDVVGVHWSDGCLSFSLNGRDLGVAFSAVPLPLRPYAHCSDGAAWDIGVVEGWQYGAEGGANFAEIAASPPLRKQPAAGGGKSAAGGAAAAKRPALARAPGAAGSRTDPGRLSRSSSTPGGHGGGYPEGGDSRRTSGASAAGRARPPSSAAAGRGEAKGAAKGARREAGAASMVVSPPVLEPLLREVLDSMPSVPRRSSVVLPRDGRDGRPAGKSAGAQGSVRKGTHPGSAASHGAH